MIFGLLSRLCWKTLTSCLLVLNLKALNLIRGCRFINNLEGDFPMVVGVALCVSKNLSSFVGTVSPMSPILFSLSLNSPTKRSARPFLAGCPGAVNVCSMSFSFKNF